MSLFASLFLLTVTHSYVVHSASYSCPGVAQYWVSFYGHWSAATHPNTFPSTPTNGFFSPLVGASHEDAYTMWDAGMLASAGIKAIAETGELFMPPMLRASCYCYSHVQIQNVE